MTADKRAKRDARDRQRHTGERYVVARRRSAEETRGSVVGDRIAAVTVRMGEQVWVRKPGSTSTPEEFVAAMEQIARWRETKPPTDLVLWNPWDYEEQRQHHGFDEATWNALQIREGWIREVPERKPVDVDALLAQWDLEDKQLRDAKAARWAEAAERYDPQRHEARLALLEDQMALRHVDEEIAGHQSRSLFPKMDPDRRAAKLDELEQTRTRIRDEIEALTAKVGDPETVVDIHGRTPADRREINLLTYKYHRREAVPQLRAQVAELDQQITANPRDTGLSTRRTVTKQRLERYLAVPPLTPDDMCADCATPLNGHGWKLAPEGQIPCPAWPRHAARIDKAISILRRAHDEAQAREDRERREAATEAKRAKQASKPRPLAVFPADTPLATVMARLARLQEKHPDAELRGGASNRLEVWRSGHSRDTTR